MRSAECGVWLLAPQFRTLDFGLWTLDFGLLLSFLPLQKLLERPGVYDKLTLAQLQHLSHQAFQEVAVVRDDDERATELQQGLSEHVFGADIEMVGGLVQNEQVGGLE